MIFQKVVVGFNNVSDVRHAPNYIFRALSLVTQISKCTTWTELSCARGQSAGTACRRHRLTASRLAAIKRKMPLIVIDNRGERLIGCLTCNLWSGGDDEKWKRLSEEDLAALYLWRHG
jgi:hypothetical protein